MSDYAATPRQEDRGGKDLAMEIWRAFLDDNRLSRRLDASGSDNALRTGQMYGCDAGMPDDLPGQEHSGGVNLGPSIAANQLTQHLSVAVFTYAAVPSSHQSTPLCRSTQLLALERVS